jgi:hypothetical protein
MKKTLLYRGIRHVWHTHLNQLAILKHYSKLALAGKLIGFPMTLITDEFAFSLAPNGWNYRCEIIAEYEKQSNIALENTKFFRFFQDERVNAIRYLDDVLFLHEPQKRWFADGFRFYLGTYPWGGLTSYADSLVGGTPFGWHHDLVTGKMTRDLWGYKRALWYKPEDRETLEWEWNYTLDHYHSFKRGYHPLLYGSFPTTTLLVRRNGEMRAVVVDGHHRLSILSQLGFKQVTLEVVQVVEESQVEHWHYVQNGQCSQEKALEIFDSFFVLNGRERLAYLNLDKSINETTTDGCNLSIAKR